MLSKFDSVISNLARFKEIRDNRKSLHPLIKCLFIEFPGITQEEIQENLEFGLKLADCVGFQEYIDPTNTIGEKKEYERDYQSSFACQQPFTRLSIAEDGTVSRVRPGLDFRHHRLSWGGASRGGGRRVQANRGEGVGPDGHQAAAFVCLGKCGRGLH